MMFLLLLSTAVLAQIPYDEELEELRETCKDIKVRPYCEGNGSRDVTVGYRDSDIPYWGGYDRWDEEEPGCIQGTCGEGRRTREKYCRSCIPEADGFCECDE